MWAAYTGSLSRKYPWAISLPRDIFRLGRPYILAKEHLDYIVEQQEKLENEYDDLLNDEIINASVLIELIEKYLLI